MVSADGKPKTIHVYVALCDNENQGIVPVPSSLGNGQDPSNNLYWGALYGVKTYFKGSSDWLLIKTIRKPDSNVLERCVFKSKKNDALLIADAYDGAKIKKTIIDFLRSSAGQRIDTIQVDSQCVLAGGAAELIVYIGHNGLMEFSVSEQLNTTDSLKRDVIILACMSRQYFGNHIVRAKAMPLLWTTGFMAPEAYTLHAAIEEWQKGSEPDLVRQRAAEAYDKYQKCGISAAMRLLVTDKK
ncbi:MAG: hypothetical protein KAR42_14310 [candidate division Zixibacteria bacterium]|nr:hypothetical protein [candidate division Zixibacteria bacterium]